ncbi:unnamed protein product [Cuscuta epithymum]|uniref:Zinc knuckle CX2CX4HX4C domain-containing protein n=1 Tax=Cuscuta epithymum TaxID=186058 RepID=A0AAV0DUB0_9ASTE|nr:unnamed protein product [Cuscuta epithymum]
MRKRQGGDLDAAEEQMGFSVVSAVITDQKINFPVFQELLASIWHPGKEVAIKGIGDKRKPLKKGTTLKKKGKGHWLDFKYEKLPNFCSMCEVIGHSDKFCPLRYEEGIVLEKLFGGRAQGRWRGEDQPYMN